MPTTTLPLHDSPFLRDYVLACGISEVPALYHRWAALSLLAACSQDRVWMEKFAGSRLVPNLYVLLLGPAGSGKDTAINMALRYVVDLPNIRAYIGKGSAAYLCSYMGERRLDRATKQHVYVNGTKLWLVTTELAFSVGSGAQADDFVKLLTALYSGQDQPWQEGTRTSGHFVIKNPCINWLAGSTVEWLCRSLSQDAIHGGFFARIVPVLVADYDFNYRVLEPTRPANHEQLVARLQDRVDAVARWNGPLRKTADAKELEAQWYTHRPEPESDLLHAVWRREHDLLLKIAMLLTVADRDDGWIGRQQMRLAQRLVREASASTRQVLLAAAFGADARHTQRVRETIRRSCIIRHSQLLQRVYTAGISDDELQRIIQTLRAANLIRVDASRFGRVYTWVGSKRPYGDNGASAGARSSDVPAKSTGAGRSGSGAQATDDDGG